MQSQANKCPGSTQHTIALDPGPAPMLSACQNNPSSVRVVIGQHHHFPTTTDTTQPPFGWMHGGTVRTPWPAFYAQKSRWQRDLAAKELAIRTVWQLMGHPGSIATSIQLTPPIPINRIPWIHRIAKHKCTTRSVTNTTTKLFGWIQIPPPSYSVGYKYHASRPAINWANRWIGVSG